MKRFWNKVHKTALCWEWTGAIDTSGYGRMAMNGVNSLAHRISWSINNGAVPDNMCILHKCDNRKCVKPQHLFVGTKDDNAKDRMLKGRNGMVKLTKQQIPKIRMLLREGVSLRKIAKQFGVTDMTIHAIKRERTWSYA